MARRCLAVAIAVATALYTVPTARADEAASGAEPLSLNFQDVAVRSALQLIADFAGLNLVAGDAVAGNITVRLEDVPWDEALDIVLAANGLDKRRSGNVLYVAPAADVAAREQAELQNRLALTALAPLVTEFVRIRYADAGPLAALFTGEGARLALSERGRMLVDERTNSLIITDTAASVSACKSMLAKLDIPVRQVQIEARIVTANENFSEQLGLRWGIALGTTGAVVLPGQESTQRTLATPRSTAQTPPRPTDEARVGITSDGGGTLGARAYGPGYWLDMELSASVAAGQVRIVSRPKVVTANKRTALIESGVEIPYQQATKSGATSIAFKDAVLQLQVTPRITPNARIVMDLEVKQDTVGRSFHGVPSINTTRIESQVLVRDGQTVVLGGILQTDKHHTVARAPLLSRLPLLGRAFRRTTERDDKQELFIFITPLIVADEADDDAEQAAAEHA